MRFAIHSCPTGRQACELGRRQIGPELSTGSPQGLNMPHRTYAHAIHRPMHRPRLHYRQQRLALAIAGSSRLLTTTCRRPDLQSRYAVVEYAFDRD